HGGGGACIERGVLQELPTRIFGFIHGGPPSFATGILLNIPAAYNCIRPIAGRGALVIKSMTPVTAGALAWTA
ncbi:MAG: hypothetical protein ACXWHI_11625, partial [Candidatus Aminicenantales bacterium]